MNIFNGVFHSFGQDFKLCVYLGEELKNVLLMPALLECWGVIC